jgi:hypothetical protein
VNLYPTHVYVGLRIFSWPIAVPSAQQINCMVSHSTGFRQMSDGWRFLMENGKTLAQKHVIQPESLILSMAFIFHYYIAEIYFIVTLVGKSQDFYIRDFRSPHFHSFSPSHHLRPGGVVQSHIFSQGSLIPSIFYLFTSNMDNFEPYWSQHYMPCLNVQKRQQLGNGWVSQIGW